MLVAIHLIWAIAFLCAVSAIANAYIVVKRPRSLVEMLQSNEEEE